MKISTLLSVVLAIVSGVSFASVESETPCSSEWNRYVDRIVVSGDGQGHGPDLGSDEWKGVVEFRLGIRGQTGLPARASDDWCQLIDRLVQKQ